MGHSREHIGFFSDEITLKPHTASEAKYLDKPVKIRTFAKNQPVSLERRDDNGEFIVTRYFTGEFMEGPMA